MSFSMAARPSAPLSPRHQKGLADEVVEPVAKKPGYSSEDACLVCRCATVDPYQSKCGHSFCYSCILASLKLSPLCPTCDAFIGDMITLGSTGYDKDMQDDSQSGDGCITSSGDSMREPKFDACAWLRLNATSIDTEDLKAIQQNIKEELVARDPEVKELRDAASLHFLGRVHLETREVNTESLAQLEAVEKDLQKLKKSIARKSEGLAVPDKKRLEVEGNIDKHFADLKKMYFDVKLPPSNFDPKPCHSTQVSSRDRFTISLGTLTQPIEMKVLRSVQLADLGHAANTIYSIGFNDNQTTMAVSSVSGGVKVYDFNRLLASPEYFNSMCVAFPPEKIATYSATWSKIHTNHLAYCDRAGHVWIWDAMAMKTLRSFKEHSVGREGDEQQPVNMRWPYCHCQFSMHYARTCFSASHDRTVRLWDTNMKSSAHVIRHQHANTGIQVIPSNDRAFAVSCGDSVLLYDTRNLSTAERVISVADRITQFRMIGAHELAAVDITGSITHWNINTGQQVCSYSGLANKESWVGMATPYGLPDDAGAGHNRFFFCGSDDRSLNSYCKHLEQPLLKQEFVKSSTYMLKYYATNYVGAIACRTDGLSLYAVAGTGHGQIKVLKLSQKLGDE